MHYSKILLLMLLGSSVALSAYAEEHRQHGAHEHGGGQLNVAVEQNRLMIELSLPAMNVVGFEHAAKNQTEKEQLAQAVTLLKDGASLMAPSTDAGCKLVTATVESALLDDEHGHDEMDSAKHDESGAENTDDHEHHHDAAEHADFDVSYEFDCKQAAKLDQLTLSLFKQFPGTKHLETQLITEMRQGGAELTAESNILNLK
jgi:hypothetical protein